MFVVCKSFVRQRSPSHHHHHSAPASQAIAFANVTFSIRPATIHPIHRRVIIAFDDIVHDVSTLFHPSKRADANNTNAHIAKVMDASFAASVAWPQVNHTFTGSITMHVFAGPHPSESDQPSIHTSIHPSIHPAIHPALCGRSAIIVLSRRDAALHLGISFGRISGDDGGEESV